MRGFLSVLNPPKTAPHLSIARRDRDRAEIAAQANDPLAWLSARAEMMFSRMGRQDELLKSVAEIVRRINGGAVRLQIRSEAVRLSHVRHLSHNKKGEHR